jgi:hypothetical protein
MDEHNGGHRALTVRADSRDLARAARQVRADMVRLRLARYRLASVQVKGFMVREEGGRDAG